MRTTRYCSIGTLGSVWIRHERPLDSTSENNTSSAASETQMKDTSLYEDKFVCVSSDGLQIKWYYFPFASSRTVAWNSIESINKEPISFLKSKGWGMGLSLVWYACDLQRQFSNDQQRYLSVTIKGDYLRSGFSVENLFAFNKAMSRCARND